MRVMTAALLILCFAFTANAGDVKVPNEYGQPGTRVDCDLTGCVLYSANVGMTLDTDYLHTFGPIGTPANGTISNVILMLDIEQTWIGDLVAWLYYDQDGNGSYDAGPVAAICRPNLAGCAFPDDCCGCSANIFGTYLFGDDAVESLGDPNCPTEIVAGCYLPAPESAAGFAATFGGLPTGGDWYLEIGDAAAGDDTMLFAWGVYVCGGTTGTERSSWGKVKKMYR